MLKCVVIHHCAHTHEGPILLILESSIRSHDQLDSIYENVFSAFEWNFPIQSSFFSCSSRSFTLIVIKMSVGCPWLLSVTDRNGHPIKDPSYLMLFSPPARLPLEEVTDLSRICVISHSYHVTRLHHSGPRKLYHSMLETNTYTVSNLIDDVLIVALIWPVLWESTACLRKSPLCLVIGVSSKLGLPHMVAKCYMIK